MIIYFDTEWDGHHPVYAAAVARHLVRYGLQDRVVFAVPERLRARMLPLIEDGDLTACRKLPFHLLDEAAIARIHGARGFLRQHFLRWRLAFDVTRETAADHVFFSVMDDVLIATGFAPWPSSVFCSGLIFRASLHCPELNRGWKGRIRWHLKALALKRTLSRRRFVRLFSLDPYFVEHAERHLRHGAKVSFLPEPIDLFARPLDGTGTPSRERMRFLFYGAMQTRKGVRPLLEALALLPDDIRTCTEFRLCGEGAMTSFIETAVARLRQVGVAVTFDARYLPQAELDAEIATADVILMPYLDHVGSSGVLLEAAARHKPVLSQASGMIGRDIRRYGLGEAVDTHDPHEIAQAIVRLAKRIERGKSQEADPDGFLARYTPEGFARKVLELA